jgi:hypothetical protein
MNVFSYPFVILLFCLTNFCLLTGNAQSDIKFHGVKINHLDKQKRKQGDWVFFNQAGLPIISCVFRDDSCNSPIIFYENGDTAFVKLPRTDSIESFILFEKKRQYFGNFVHTSDSTSRIEIEMDSSIDDFIINKIKKYKNIVIGPVFYFAQKRMIDFLSAGFIGSKLNFNKPINVLLTISSSGLVTKVEFPRDKNNLSADEETELHWIYSKLQRWQPYFYENRVRAVKVLLSNNSSLSITSFEH